MYINSTPIEEQYTLSKCLIISANVLGFMLTILAASKTVVKSACDNPKFSIAKVGENTLLSLTGFVFVNKWPRVR